MATEGECRMNKAEGRRSDYDNIVLTVRAEGCSTKGVAIAILEQSRNNLNTARCNGKQVSEQYRKEMKKCI